MREDQPRNHPEDSPEARQHRRLREELPQDLPAARADGLLKADFRGPLRHGHQHNVHNADAADEERDARDAKQKNIHRIVEGRLVPRLRENVVHLVIRAVLGAGIGICRNKLGGLENAQGVVPDLRHVIRLVRADHALLNLIKMIEDRPAGIRHEHRASIGGLTHKVLRHAVVGGHEIVLLPENAHDVEDLASNLHGLPDGLPLRKKGARRGSVQHDDLAEVLEIVRNEIPAGTHAAAQGVEVMVVHAVNAGKGEA